MARVHQQHITNSFSLRTLEHDKVINGFCGFRRHITHVMRIPAQAVHKRGSDDVYSVCLARAYLDHLSLGNWVGTVLRAGSLAR